MAPSPAVPSRPRVLVAPSPGRVARLDALAEVEPGGPHTLRRARNERAAAEDLAELEGHAREETSVRPLARRHWPEVGRR